MLFVSVCFFVFFVLLVRCGFVSLFVCLHVFVVFCVFVVVVAADCFCMSNIQGRH